MKVKIRKATSTDFKIFQNLNTKLFFYDKKFDPELDLKWPNKKVGVSYYQDLLKENNSLTHLQGVLSLTPRSSR
ncbi:MAG TPA: hypothetical protein VMW41_04690 [Candidatus Bathyarchaeia archaeon]|nr:hypothetical protein [Candidatus Bathyarchaeia archaeon]